MARRRLTCALAAAALVAALAPASAQDAAPASAALSAKVATLNAPDDPTKRASYVRIVRREALARGLPPEVAETVAEIESGTSPDAVGGVGEIGLMQIRPATAEMLGHDGGALALFDPETNARFAVRYLAQAWKLAMATSVAR
jgi:soluble lytic murein transglycosylase-like protein